MKATELMVGDWVYSTFSQEPCRIVCIEQYPSGYCMVKVDKVVGIKDIASLSGIPLTSDILNKKFPDVRHNLAWYWNDTKSTDKETWYEVRTLDIEDMELCVNIRYVHELQHALRLCGIEKEIVL